MMTLLFMMFCCFCLCFTRASPLIRRAPSRCRDVSFKVSATAEGRKSIEPPTVFGDNPETRAYFAQPELPATISGSQSIYGHFCEPFNTRFARSRTLLLLVHGITYDHTYWNAFQSSPDIANPNAMAAWLNQQGFATLAIDRLGVGKSSHPDPISVVQAPYQRKLYHDIISQLRSNSQLGIPST